MKQISILTFVVVTLVGCSSGSDTMPEPAAPKEQQVVMVPAAGQGSPKPTDAQSPQANPTAMPDQKAPGDK